MTPHSCFHMLIARRLSTPSTHLWRRKHRRACPRQSHFLQSGTSHTLETTGQTREPWWILYTQFCFLTFTKLNKAGVWTTTESSFPGHFRPVQGTVDRNILQSVGIKQHSVPSGSCMQTALVAYNHWTSVSTNLFKIA
jgi:hypothetical protein